jgi:hypothetical protein
MILASGLRNPDSQMSKATFLTTQLRESASYLQDAGFRQTADMVIAAADEIELLRAMLDEALADPEPAQREANENERPVRKKSRSR